jgi:hypothetical protein
LKLSNFKTYFFIKLRVFYEVAKIPALEDADLETIPMEA